VTDNGAGQDPGQGPGSLEGWEQRGLRALAALEQTWDASAAVCRDLSASEWARRTDCPGWDVKDQLSHLIGVERSIMGDPAPAWDAPLGEHVKNEFAALNEPWIAARRALPGPDVLAEFVEVIRTRRAQEAALSEEQWAAVGWSPLGDRPHAVFMEVRVFDSWVHEQDIRRALDRPGGGGNQASAMALDRVRDAMPFVVGKRSACPDGTAVRFDVAGPGEDARSFTVAVEGGRAHIAGDRPAPTVTLSLSSIEFLRLGCGRVAAAEVEAEGAVVLRGDAGLGRTVLAAMNFMF
jgi:uncharacterized protein (TIGR03083 family)